MLSSNAKLGLAVLVVMILIAGYYYYTTHKACETDADCKSPQTCDATKKVCSTPASTKAMAKAKRRSGFNSDEMNWPTAGSLVSGDTFPYGDLSGYNVTGLAASYDTLYP